MSRDNNALIVTSVPVQQQMGICDCGIFAIAFAVHTAAGSDVSSLAFYQNKMRSHLIQCLTKKELSPFLQTRRASVKINKLSHIAIPSYCDCGGPDSLDEMVQCDKGGGTSSVQISRKLHMITGTVQSVYS